MSRLPSGLLYGFMICASALAQNSRSAEWKDFESNEGRFTASFLGEPEQSTTIKGETTSFAVESRVSYGQAASSYQVVAYPRLKASGWPVTQADEVIRAFLALGAEKLMDLRQPRSTRAISLGSNPGVELIVEERRERSDASGSMYKVSYVRTIRAYWTDDFIYYLVASDERGDSKSTAKFLDSFKPLNLQLKPAKGTR